MTRRVPCLRAAIAAALAAGAMAAPAAGQAMPSDRVPVGFESVGITDRRGEQIPLDLRFVNEQGETVELASYFESGRPVILTLNYFRCPMLCSLILNGLIDGLDEMDWSAGEQFEIITVSFNPEEGHELAELKKRAYLTQYKRPKAAEGWHFLTGGQEAITALTDAVGYGYRYDEASGEYVHPSTIVFLTPRGVVSLYMDDVMFDPRDLRLALVEASEGRIGSPLDKFALFVCFQYDPDAGGYTVVAWKVMRAGGLLTLTMLMSGLGLLWYREHRGRHTLTTPPGTGPEA